MKLATAVAALGLSVLALLGTAPGVSRAETVRTDYVVDFHPPDPGLYDFSAYTLQGTFDVYFQPTATRTLSWLAQTRVVELGFNESRNGSLSFDVDFSAAEGNLLITFGGIVVPDPGPPDMPFYAFPPNPVAPDADPGSAPFIDLGVIGVGLPEPGPPDMPLYAFGSVHEIGSLAVTVAAIPEPETYALMGIGLGLLGWVARRRKQQVNK